MAMGATVKRSLALLSNRDKRRLWMATAVQVAGSLLDLIGVLLLGLVGALAVTVVQEQPAPAAARRVAGELGLATLSDLQLLAIFSCLAAAALLSKSLLSAFVLRRVFRFLAGRQAVVSARLARMLLGKSLTFVQQRSSQEIAYALIQGSSAATLGVLGQAVIVVSESALLLVLGVALTAISPVIALSSAVFFGLVAMALQFSLGSWASRAGQSIYESDVASLDAVQEVISAYREVTIADRRSHYVDRIEELRWSSAHATSDYQFIGVFPKYVLEVALVVGGFTLAGVLFATQETSVAVGSLAVFIASATRIMPSILRVQGAAISLRNSAGIATSTFDLALALEGDRPTSSAESTRELSAGDAIKSDQLVPTVEVHQVTFCYPGSGTPAVSEVSLRILEGTSVALVGRSGAGKSTLVDLVLGMYEPDSGSIRIGGLTPSTAVATWPGSVGYVPQDVILANGTIRQNVALGLPREAVDDWKVWEALERAHIADLIRHDREGLDTRVGERGMRLSGGQRQRLGIARALYSRPTLLVLDEATSALDAETELALTQTLNSLEGSVTTIVIAHRLSTVRHADELVYMEKGVVMARGSFDSICALVPAFYRQAVTMGLR